MGNLIVQGRVSDDLTGEEGRPGKEGKGSSRLGVARDCQGAEDNVGGGAGIKVGRRGTVARRGIRGVEGGTFGGVRVPGKELGCGDVVKGGWGRPRGQVASGTAGWVEGTSGS